MCESVGVFKRYHFHSFRKNSQTHLETAAIAGVKENQGIHWRSAQVNWYLHPQKILLLYQAYHDKNHALLKSPEKKKTTKNKKTKQNKTKQKNKNKTEVQILKGL